MIIFKINLININIVNIFNYLLLYLYNIMNSIFTYRDDVEG
jgi:hypothetical protein